MTHVLVTGANGQTGQTLQKLSTKQTDTTFYFTDRNELDISKANDVLDFFDNYPIDWCINCAAYTAVDKAETEEDLAKQVNTTAVLNLALASKRAKSKLVHISTDFVFDGCSNTAYTETDKINPLGIYGKTKAEGENILRSNYSGHFIIRTSWLYSEFGQNFMKTMLRLSEEKDSLNVVTDQIGSPTYAGDLVSFILKIVANESKAYGTYHFCNTGISSWYDFAKAIFELSNSKVQVLPIKTENYPTPAKRPVFSVLDQSKLIKTFDYNIPYWRDSLKIALQNL
jgi:dTDP-4-dehydrorhamnose reductase